MPGDVADFVRRMLQVLPVRWFADAPPIASAVLAGFGSAWAFIYGLIGTVRLMARIATATGPFLDLISIDFFAAGLPRRSGETDAAFLLRIQQEMLRPRATRAALHTALTELTGQAPVIFEPVRPADTGGYTVGGVGYATPTSGSVVGGGGGWGNLQLRHQSFITVLRPLGEGIAYLAGYGTAGALAYGDLSMVATPVTDAQIFAQVTAVVPAGHLAWVRLM
jgi:hypothetical protein